MRLPVLPVRPRTIVASIALIVGLISASVLTLHATPARAAILKGNWSRADDTGALKQPCADVLFVGLRGSGENDDFGSTIRAVRDDIKAQLDQSVNDIRVRQVYVDYTAAGVDVLLRDLASQGWKLGGQSRWNYFASIQDGSDRLRKVLNDSTVRCRSHPEKWVLAGYSQGAISINNVLSGFADPNRYAGIYLVGDPSNFRDRTGTKYGSAPKSARGIYDLTIRTPVPGALKGRSYSYCDKYDFFCDTVRSVAWYGIPTSTPIGAINQQGVEVHEGYRNRAKLKDSLAAIELNLLKINVPTGRPTAVAIKDTQLKICIQHQQQLDGRPVAATPTTADLARLTRLDCPQPEHIHGWTIDFAELALGTKLTFIRYWTDAPPQYQDLSPLSKLTHLTALYENLSQCRLPIASVHGQCVPA